MNVRPRDIQALKWAIARAAEWRGMYTATNYERSMASSQLLAQLCAAFKKRLAHVNTNPRRTKMSKNRYRTEERTLEGALEACQELIELRNELQERYDNMPENLQSGNVASILESSISSMDSIEEVDLPDSLKHLRETDVSTAVEYKSRGLSRRARRDNAVSWLRAACDLLSERAASFEDYASSESTPTSGHAPEGHDGPWTQEEYSEAQQEAEELVSTLEDYISSAEEAEFPGMYG